VREQQAAELRQQLTAAVQALAAALPHANQATLVRDTHRARNAALLKERRRVAFEARKHAKAMQVSVRVGGCEGGGGGVWVCLEVWQG
jgi:hypothetical protein